jgi:hypothetical protein
LQRIYWISYDDEDHDDRYTSDDPCDCAVNVSRLNRGTASSKITPEYAKNNV